MGIFDTILRSKDDLVKPESKSYWGCELEIDLANVKDIIEKSNLLPSEKRLVAYELSGKEPINQIIVVSNTNKELGRLTTSQLKDILDDMGFNVDTILSGSHYSDTTAVMNINGFVAPGWRTLAGIVKEFNPVWEKLLLSKLSPGKERLHIRIFEMNDGRFIVAAHTDLNWMSFNIFKVFNAHLSSGRGNYKLGTAIMFKLLKKFNENLRNNRTMDYDDIKTVVESEISSKEGETPT